jgi:hypothetical protein
MRFRLLLVTSCTIVLLQLGASLSAQTAGAGNQKAQSKKKPSDPTQIASAKAGNNAFNCTQRPMDGWVALRGGESQAVYVGTTVRRYRLANQPALSRPTQLIATFDGQDIEVPPVPAAIDVEGKNIVVRNASNSPYQREF